MKVCILAFLSIGGLFLVAVAQTNLPPLPPPYTVPQAIIITSNPFVVGTNVYRYLKPPTPATNFIHLGWVPNTNLWNVVQASTDSITWYEKARLPIWQTNIDFPETNPYELFRIYTDFTP